MGKLYITDETFWDGYFVGSIVYFSKDGINFTKHVKLKYGKENVFIADPEEYFVLEGDLFDPDAMDPEEVKYYHEIYIDGRKKYLVAEIKQVKNQENFLGLDLKWMPSYRREYYLNNCQRTPKEG